MWRRQLKESPGPNRRRASSSCQVPSEGAPLSLLDDGGHGMEKRGLAMFTHLWDAGESTYACAGARTQKQQLSGVNCAHVFNKRAHASSRGGHLSRGRRAPHREAAARAHPTHSWRSNGGGASAGSDIISSKPLWRLVPEERRASDFSPLLRRTVCCRCC